MQRFFSIRELQVERSKSGKRYLEFLRVPALSTGLTCFPKKGKTSRRRTSKTRFITW